MILLFETVEHDFCMFAHDRKHNTAGARGRPVTSMVLLESEARLRQHDNLLLQLLFGEDEPSHDVVQLFQSQLGMEYSDVVRIRANRPLQSPVEVQQDLTENLGKTRHNGLRLTDTQATFF